MRFGIPTRSAVAAVLALGFVASGLLATPALGDPAVPAPKPTGVAAARVAEPRMSAAFRLAGSDGVEYTPNARNVALRTAPGAPLLLFLPATNQVPRDYRDFLRTAAGVGYHVLALDYWNRGLSVARTCGTDPQCYSQLQANRFDGSHPSRFSAITVGNSILSRLRCALRTLDARDPRGGWGAFLAGDRVRWDHIVLAGHSQGGGESAFIAHHHRVQGVLMFGSPVESDGGVTAAWMAHRGVTPVDRYYALDSARDMYADRIAGSWRALHIPGRPTVIGDRPPTLMRHQLVTDRMIGDHVQSHSRFITDRGPRGERNVPLFQGIWLAMLHAVRSASPGAA